MTESNITDVIEAHLKAYIAKDIEAFAACFADNIRSWNHSDPSSEWTGKEELRKRYSKLFATADKLDPQIRNRIVTPPYVIDEEFALGIPAKPEGILVGVIYKVENGKIAEMCFLR